MENKKILLLVIMIFLTLVFSKLDNIQLYSTLLSQEGVCWNTAFYNNTLASFENHSNAYSFKWNLEYDLSSMKGDTSTFIHKKNKYSVLRTNELKLNGVSYPIITMSKDTVVLAEYSMPHENVVYTEDGLIFKDTATTIWQTFYLIKRDCPKVYRDFSLAPDMSF